MKFKTVSRASKGVEDKQQGLQQEKIQKVLDDRSLRDGAADLGMASVMVKHQETPGDLTTRDRVSPKVKVFLILVIGDRVGSQLKVLDESQDKTTSTDEGTSTKPGVPDVPKYLSKSENESWGDSGNDDNDDDSNEVTKDDDKDDVESDANEDKEASDSEKTDSDEDENLMLNQNDDEEEEKEEEDIRTPDSFEFNDDDDEDYDELYKDVNVRSKVTKHEEVGKGDAEMTDTTLPIKFQAKTHSVSSDFASKILNLDNVSPVIDEVASIMTVKTPHEESSTQAPPLLTVPVTAILKTSTVVATTVPPIIQPFSSIP
ncbi:hypothetical protein Tco_0506178 [Tanacetum coccineum]